MSQALLFLVDTALSLLLYVFLLRLMLHWARGNFRNPFAQALLKFSNWLVIPLRRILPALGRVDTASLVGAYAVTLIKIAAFNLGGCVSPANDAAEDEEGFVHTQRWRGFGQE